MFTDEIPTPRHVRLRDGENSTEFLICIVVGFFEGSFEFSLPSS